MERLSMRKIREYLRLRFEAGLSRRQIAASLQVARSSLGEYERRFAATGLTWPLPASLSDAELERRLFPPPPAVPIEARVVPDWSTVHQELRRPGVTLMLLWEEYRATHPQGFGYSWFCKSYEAWSGKLDVVMRQTHRAGEKLFVDYAGQTVEVIDRSSGEVRTAQIFVAVLGASNYTYAEATWSQNLADWIGAHVRAFAFLGGVPELLVPDNLASGVSKAHRYEPDLNPTYAELAAHYGVAVIPARVRRPRDKAKVEAGVQVVERLILAVLRHRTFFSLRELNGAIAELLERLNRRPFKKLPGSRLEAFETIDRPALRPLPATPYVYATWKRVRVNIDYHVEVDGHYYSVPYALVKQALEVRVTDHTVECFHQRQRVASHVRSALKGRHTTVAEHMPKAHREYADWTPERLVRWAEKTGPATAGVVAHILANRPHPQQGFRSCLGILRLGERHGNDRLEAACARALRFNACRYKSIESILQRGLDRQAWPEQPTLDLPPAHDHLRGPGYFH
ncbi:IS21 family transposase [Thiorhodococcus minor]|uniref:IS21 family transposase n=1 Tax=Thiorhodococcus minor TaxID=57489 RepID=A0A6M0JUR3_9GAMM|nr:IS21 family transposase [Thiorhodococcus minor]NEV60323.1 IS21 family transposase [Thiorhodococcus minor]